MVKQISDSEIYFLIKYVKSVLWGVAKCQFGEAFTSCYIFHLLCEIPLPLSWAEYDYCRPLTLLAFNCMKNVLQRLNMLNLHAVSLFVTELVGFVPGGLGSLEIIILLPKLRV